MNRLRSCDACARHVFVSERVCPFCLIELAPAAERATVPFPSGASRAQRLALAAALGSTTLLACGEVREISVPVYDAPPAGNQALPLPAAGSPASPDAGFTPPPVAGGGGGVRDGGIAVPVYGAPVYGAPLAGQPAPVPPPKQPDAAVPPDDDAGVSDPSRAGSGGRGGMPVPVYGAPLPEYGAPPPPKD